MNVGLPLPKRFYRAEHVEGFFNDLYWISQQLARLTLPQRAKAAEAYSEAYTGDDMRAECNSRLRKFVERCERVNKGAVSMPPKMRG